MDREEEDEDEEEEGLEEDRRLLDRERDRRASPGRAVTQTEYARTATQAFTTRLGSITVNSVNSRNELKIES